MSEIKDTEQYAINGVCLQCFRHSVLHEIRLRQPLYYEHDISSSSFYKYLQFVFVTLSYTLVSFDSIFRIDDTAHHVLTLPSVTCLLVQAATKYPIRGSEEIMKKKAHGTSDLPVQSNLKYGCDVALADRICNFNRRFAEHAGEEKTKSRKEL
jgi:hypothetical protein